MNEQTGLKTGERRIVTVLFSDMKGFTNLSEKMDPEEVDALMNRVFSLFESIITRHEGTVEKYIGDALVAVFGATRIHEDDPARAVNAALDFQGEILRENNDLKNKRLSLSFRTGIHCGLITTGKRGKFDVVTGHTMSVASRLQERAEPNTVYVSGAVRERCESDFLFSEPFTFRVKGKDDDIVAYKVTGRNSIPFMSTDPFVGHDSLLDEMLRMYLRHAPDKCTACMITGEAGIGKTELAARFLQKLRQFPGTQPVILYSRAQKYRPVHFAVIIDLLTNFFQLNLYENAENISRHLMSRFRIDEETARGCCTLLANASEWRVVDRAFLILQRMMEYAFSSVKGSLYPPLVYIDCIHYLDESSRNFIQFLLESDGAKPFFLFTGRDIPENVRSLFPGQGVIQLGPLNRDESLAYIRNLWPECTDEEMLQTILKNSLGNPLFIREYVKLARASRDMSLLPMTIQNIFLMSLEKYPESLRDLIKKLSVFFLSFTTSDAEYLERKTEGDPGSVPSSLERLKADGILIQEGSCYFFKHDVFKKALYNSLLNYNKRILHRHVAALLMERGKPHLPRLLQHLIRAEDYETARKVLLREPNRVFSLEYVKFVDIILENTDKTNYDAVIECLFTKSAILFNNGKTEAMDSILKQILSIAVSTKNSLYSANAYHLLTAYNVNSYAFQKALFCGRKAINFYRKSGTGKRAVYDLLRTLALSELLRNDGKRSLEFIRQMEPDPDPEIEALRRDALLDRHLLLGEYREALKYVPDSEPDGGDSSEDAWFYSRFTVTKLYWQLCDYENLKTLIRKMLKVGTKHFSILSQITAQLAVCSHISGDEDAARESFAQAELYRSQIRNDFDCIDALRTLSVCYAHVGNLVRAEAVASEGITIGLRHSSCYPVFTLLILLAEIYMKTNRNRETRFIMEEAGFYLDLGVMLSRKDLALYHYVKYRLDADPFDLERSRELTGEEKQSIETQSLVEAFMATRSFGELERAGSMA